MKSQFNTLPPLSLYIHIPWCVRKCPYCDFNSHAITNNELQEKKYIESLIMEFKQQLNLIEGRDFHSIFIGGGTPSLFSASSIAHLLETINFHIPFKNNLEITMEANPGTVEQQRFKEFHAAGINRLSIGIQSFQDDKLKTLGRIHSANEAIEVARSVRNSGFENFNLDLMYGLPDQSVADALFDLKIALDIDPTHLSWYQLTIEPNTAFYKKPPLLPEEDLIIEMEQQGRELLSAHDFTRYEISAYCRDHYFSQHNINYWQFGDYLGIGAGAHSKITRITDETILRFHNVRQPTSYLTAENNWIAKQQVLDCNSIIFEFMLNVLRLQEAVPFSLFEARTGLPKDILFPYLDKGVEKGLLSFNEKNLELSSLGHRFLNDAINLFL